MVEIGKDEIRGKISDITRLSEEAYKKLSEAQAELSVEALAKFLTPYCEYADEADMPGQIEEIKSGLEDGAKGFEDVYKTYVEGGEQPEAQMLLRKKTNEMFDGLSESLQRVFLYNILCGLCMKDGEQDAKFMLYMANMSVDELKDKACGIMCDKCRVETDNDILDVINAAQTENIGFKEYKKADGKDHDLIDAAAAYTVMRKSGSIDARKFAEQFAFRKRMLWSMVKAESIDIVERSTEILCAEAAAFALYCAIYAQSSFGTTMFLKYGEFFTFVFPKMFLEAICGVIVQTREFEDAVNDWQSKNTSAKLYFTNDCCDAEKRLGESISKIAEEAQKITAGGKTDPA